MWFGIVIMSAMSFGLVAWIVYVMKKEKGKE